MMPHDVRLAAYIHFRLLSLTLHLSVLGPQLAKPSLLSWAADFLKVPWENVSKNIPARELLLTVKLFTCTLFEGLTT